MGSEIPMTKPVLHRAPAILVLAALTLLAGGAHSGSPPARRAFARSFASVVSASS